MDLSIQGNGSVFHIYVRGLKRIACGCREEIHAVIVEEQMQRLRDDSLCPNCLAALAERAGTWLPRHEEELVYACCVRG